MCLYVYMYAFLVMIFVYRYACMNVWFRWYMFSFLYAEIIYMDSCISWNNCVAIILLTLTSISSFIISFNITVASSSWHHRHHHRHSDKHTTAIIIPIIVSEPLPSPSPLHHHDRFLPVLGAKNTADRVDVKMWVVEAVWHLMSGAALISGRQVWNEAKKTSHEAVLICYLLKREIALRNDLKFRLKYIFPNTMSPSTTTLPLPLSLFTTSNTTITTSTLLLLWLVFLLQMKHQWGKRFWAYFAF